MENLVLLFTSAFHIFVLSDSVTRYELITPNYGDDFDSDLHSVKGSKTDGKISKVLLPGVYDVLNDRIVFKTVVEII